MKRFQFIATLFAPLTLLFRKKPISNEVKITSSTPPKLMHDGRHFFVVDDRYTTWIDQGEITFGETITTDIQEPNLVEFTLNKTNKVEVCYTDIDRGLYIVEEYDTETEERKVLRQYHLKDMKM